MIFILLLFLTLPANLFGREFLNTYMHINFLYMYGLSTWGDITDYEHKSYSIPDPNNNLKNVHPDHKDTAYGLMLDITPFPAFILGYAEHAVKIGFRVAYRFHNVEQDIQLENRDYTGDLMKFQALMYGIVIYYAPTIEPSLTSKHYNASKGLSFFALMGNLQGGEITAYPIWKKHDPSTYPPAINSAPDSTPIKGYKFDVGVGGEVSVCGSVNIGLNFYYSYISYEMTRNIYPGVGRNSSLKEVCLEIYMGIPIQYF